MKIHPNTKHPKTGDIYMLRGIPGKFKITGINGDIMSIEVYPLTGDGYGSKSLKQHIQHIREGRIRYENKS